MHSEGRAQFIDRTGTHLVRVRRCGTGSWQKVSCKEKDQPAPVMRGDAVYAEELSRFLRQTTELHLLLAISRTSVRSGAQVRGDRCAYDSPLYERSVPRYAETNLQKNVQVGKDP